MLPDTDVAPIVNADAPTQMLDGEPAAAAGSGFVVIVTEFELEQPPEFVSVSV